MKTYPVFQDAIAYSNMAKGQFPLYITINPLENIRIHYCDFIEFSLFIDGYGTETVNGVPHTFRPGTATLTLPHHIHEIRSDPGSSTVKYCCMFSIDILSDLPLGSSVYHLLLKTGSIHPSFAYFDQESRHRILDVFAEIKNEYEGDQIGRIDLIRTKLAEALLLFVRARQQTFSDSPSQDQLETEHVILEVIPYLHLNYMNEGLTLSTVAKAFNVSSSYISNSMKKYTGQCFHDYILSLKILSATSLLQSSELTISEIAAEVGFKSSRTFYRVFKKIKGVTPDRYRST
jgi:AraC-like DNA-binding protein